jgi:hypothetical protein
MAITFLTGEKVQVYAITPSQFLTIDIKTRLPLAYGDWQVTYYELERQHELFSPYYFDSDRERLQKRLDTEVAICPMCDGFIKDNGIVDLESAWLAAEDMRDKGESSVPRYTMAWHGSQILSTLADMALANKEPSETEVKDLQKLTFALRTLLTFYGKDDVKFKGQ